MQLKQSFVYCLGTVAKQRTFKQIMHFEIEFCSAFNVRVDQCTLKTLIYQRA